MSSKGDPRMSDMRRWVLERNEDLKLTQREMDYGYHFCPDWDGALIGPGDPEMGGCGCDIRTG